MPLELDLQVASAAPDLPSEAQFRAWCELALRQRPESELTIRLVDEAEGLELNSTYRHKDYATNVLSFPADVPDELLDIPLLGDLVICAPVVAREAPGTAQAVAGPLGPPGDPRLPAPARLRPHRRRRSGRNGNTGT